uniref:Uncharacterized protein n=1 Tax=Anguilla anguilla TaxID=7936 RepID=A0A0E9S421_ANGAN
MTHETERTANMSASTERTELRITTAYHVLGPVIVIKMQIYHYHYLLLSS